MRYDHPSRSSQLPDWAVRLLQRLAPWRKRDVIVGDFAEVFEYIATDKGRGHALRWFVAQVLRSIPSFISDGFYFGSIMIGNYFKIALRNLMKRKFYSALNICGLAIGMAACLLIFQYVAFEYSYDTFHEHQEDLYRITTEMLQGGESTGTSVYSWSALGPAAQEALPEVRGIARFHPNYGTASIAHTDAGGTRSILRTDAVVFTDSSFLDLFSFPLLWGDRRLALRQPRTALLSASLAETIFGETNPIGQVLDIRAWTNGLYTVTGVFEDVPTNSHMQFDVLLPIDDILDDEDGQYADEDGWGWLNFVTFVALQPGTAPEATAPKLADIVANNKAEEFTERNRRTRVTLQPLTDIHLYSDFDEGFVTAGNSYKMVYFFTVVAFFILLIAWVNYVNLSTARALERAKEVGVRKVAGARKSQLVNQFVFESALVNLAALTLGIALAVLALPYLNEIAAVEISLSTWQNPWLWVSLAGVFGIGVLTASLYPAFVLSAFKPAVVLKSSSGWSGGRELLRKGLVVFQFAV